MTNINEMQQALIRQGLTPEQVSSMSEEQLRAACSKKLQASLNGNVEGSNNDQFAKDLKYNIEFPLNGEKIKVAKLSTKTLPSGRKIEAFVDVAGNQYFQYRAADNTLLNEKFFKKEEKIGPFEKFQIQDNKLVVLDMFGAPKTVFQNNKAQAAILHPEYAENKVDVNKKLQETKLRNHLNSLPEVKASYTDLMRGIKFKNASKEEQIDMLLQNAGERYQIAKQQGNKQEMKKLLIDGLSLSFQKMDMELGITRVKEDTKEFYGLNALTDTVDKWVDDGNEENLTALEKAWEAVKGVGDAADSFIGTQGIATIGAIGLAAKASVAAATAAGGAKAGQFAMAAIQGYFGYEGASLVVEGTGDIINAENKEEARGGGAKVGMGGVMLYGTYKSFKAGYDAYKANKLAMQEQQALMDGAKKVLDIPEGTDITETVLKDAYKKAALKTHPDKGGSVEAFDAVKDAYDLLKRTLETTTRQDVIPNKEVKDLTLQDRLNLAKSREEFTAIRDKIKKLPQSEEKTQLIQVLDLVLKKYEKGSISDVDYRRLKEVFPMILQKNHADIIRMEQFSKSLDKLYEEMIVPEFHEMVYFMLGENINIEKDGKFYKAKGENGIMSGRSKGASSIFSKVRNKVFELKVDAPKTLDYADILIGDAGGFRYTINQVDNNVTQKIISEIVPKHERAEFDKYFAESYKLTPLEKSRINKNFLDYEKMIYEKTIHAQSDIFVAKLCDGIETGKIHIQEINNYCGHDGIPYFSQEHLQHITLSYNQWFKKACESPEYIVIKDENGVINCIKDKFGNKFNRALTIEDSQTNPEKIKESGYTSSQFNIIGNNGLRIEFQYRSSKINDFAEYEHVPYDIRGNKETVKGKKYDKIRNILANKDKMGNAEYKYYNTYLTQIYNYYRRIELGLPVGEKPVLNKDNFKKLTPEDIALISVDGLKELHDGL